MATEQNLECISIPSSGDLSASQYLGIDINSSGLAAVVASSGAEGIGILQNKPTSTSEAATVATEGISKAVAGAAITAGAKVMFSAAGKVITATGTGKHVIGKAVTAASGDGIVISVLLGARHVLA